MLYSGGWLSEDFLIDNESNPLKNLYSLFFETTEVGWKFVCLTYFLSAEYAFKPKPIYLRNM